jgi:EmrB/QacA subfamily drug resistance transporter
MPGRRHVLHRLSSIDSIRGPNVNDAAPGAGPLSIAALRDAILKGREPPPVQLIARLGAYRWCVVGTVCIGAFMGQVDSSITQLLLPRLEREFGASLSTVSWVAVAYLLAMAAFMPIFGRLADMLGRKLLYTGGFLLFVLGSAFCGLAPSLPVLIAFRVLQAIGAALLSSNSVAIIVTAAGSEHRGRALGIQSAAQAIGLSVGPALGGLVLDTLGWQWVFWINVPVGLVGAIVGWLVIPQTTDLPQDSRFDWKGALLIVPALTALMALVNDGHAWGLVSPLFLGGALLAMILLAWFVGAEHHAVVPLIDLKLFRSAAFVGGNIAGLLSYAILFGLMFLMPFMFVRAYGTSALEAGLRLTMVPLVLGAIAPVGGGLYDKLGPRVLTVSGMLICIAGLLLLFATMDGTSADLSLVMLALAIFGLGLGLFISPNNSAIMGAAPAELTGEAGGLLNVMRSLGTSVGIAASSALLSWRLATLTGSGQNTLGVSRDHLLAAGRDVILLLVAFAVVAGAVSLLRSSPKPLAPAHVSA